MKTIASRVGHCVFSLVLASGCGDGASPAEPSNTSPTAGSGGMPSSASSSSVSASGSAVVGGSANGASGAGGGATSGSAGTSPESGGAGGMAGTAPAPPPIGGAAGGSNAGAGGTTVACNLQHAKGALKLDLMSGGVARKVRLFVPAAYDGSKPLPLVLNLHGSGDNADNFAKSTQMESLADSEGFLVAGLEALAGEWNTPPDAGKPDDVAYAGDAIDLVMKTVCTDDKRVYASGFSGGARTTSQLGCKLPERITAIVPVAGVRWPAPCAGRPVPVLAIHGLADTENMYAGEGPTHPKWNESVEDAIEGWATKNGCNQARVVDDPAGAVSIYRYGQCQADATVKLLRMDGVGHAYPTGTPIHAAKKAWSFLKAFARP